MTILFLKDYADYPNAIVDTQTSNKSALNLAGLYRAMGKKNYFLPLILLQPELQGIDPFSRTLPEELKAKIALECELNPWYFFREIARVPAQAGMRPNQYRLNRANMALYFSFLNNVDFALIMPRQLGKSLGTDLLMIWLMIFVLWNSKINMLTKDNSLRVANVERIKSAMDLLPPYLRFLDKKEADNQHTITYNIRGNKYQTAVAQSAESAALNVGRGLTSPIIHIDEGPFIKFIGTIIPALLASGGAAREEARMNGQPYGNIFTTTAGKKDDRDGKYMYDLIHGGAPWDEEYFDLPDKKAFQQVVNKNSSGKKPMINGTFSHRQVGKSDDWLREVLANTNAQGDEADRDFFNVWTSGTLMSPLTPKLNNLIKDSQRDPLFREFTDDGYIFNWFVEEDVLEDVLANGKFVLGMDTSELVGRDDCGMVIIDIRDLSVIGTANVNETNIISYANFVAKMLVRFPTITLNIERKSTGVTFLDALLLELPRHGIDPFERIFNKAVNLAMTDEKYRRILNTPMNLRGTYFYEDKKTLFGFVTTADSRKELFINILPEMAKRAGGSVHCEVLSSQIRALVVKNGRIDHTSSGHDDMVISWLIAGWTVMKGKNLQHYGIDPSLCLAYAGQNGESLTDEDVIHLEEQRILRAKIMALKEELLAAQDGYAISKLETKILHLCSLTEKDGGVPLSMDALLQESELDDREDDNGYTENNSKDNWHLKYSDEDISYC